MGTGLIFSTLLSSSSTFIVVVAVFVGGYWVDYFRGDDSIGGNCESSCFLSVV